jgi:hypothetical protein
VKGENWEEAYSARPEASRKKARKNGLLTCDQSMRQVGGEIIDYGDLSGKKSIRGIT